MGSPDSGGGSLPVPVRRLWARVVAVAAVGVIGVLYVVSAVITAGPITPLSLRYGEVANKVIQPYFAQNWQLFAPDPISEEWGTLARLRCVDGRTTDFVDITSPHIDAIHNTRLFPSRQQRIVSNSMLSIFVQDPHLRRYREKLIDEEVVHDGATTRDDPLLAATREEIAVREQAESVLARFAIASVPYGCEGDPEAVQLRYMMHRFPPWSERHRWDETGTVEILESAWLTAG